MEASSPVSALLRFFDLERDKDAGIVAVVGVGA